MITAYCHSYSVKPQDFLQGPDCYPTTLARKPAPVFQYFLTLKWHTIERNRKKNLLMVLPKNW